MRDSLSRRFTLCTTGTSLTRIVIVASVARTVNDQGPEGNNRGKDRPVADYRKFLPLNDELFDYLQSNTTKPDPVQRGLIDQTRELGDSQRMQIAHPQAVFMTFLTRAIGARSAIEIGTFTGYSALAIARGLPADGSLIACDVSEAWTAVAREAWKTAGVADRIELRIGPASQTLGSLAPDVTFDLAFIDADKESYIEYYEALLPRLEAGGLLLADNTLWEGKVTDSSIDDSPTRSIRAFNAHVAADPRTEQVLLSIADGLTLIRQRPDTG
ncbi:MAG: class I SAM-dependent methyltransferase [Gemmatimonadetes bacterium]|nr:class I SAM-dependent methyltransferase [Gemmatimonadota bacterium]